MLARAPFEGRPCSKKAVMCGAIALMIALQWSGIRSGPRWRTSGPGRLSDTQTPRPMSYDPERSKAPPCGADGIAAIRTDLEGPGREGVAQGTWP